jgi:hypothetical protein
MRNTSYIEYYNPDSEDEEYVELEVVWSYYYEPAVMYLSNGDPGYPAEEEFSVISSRVVSHNGVKVNDMQEPEWLNWDDIGEEIFRNHMD